MNHVEAPFQNLFIHRPLLQQDGGRNIYRLITLVAWSAYLYLWLPIATLVLWWLSTRLGFREFQRYPDFIDFALFWLMIKALLITTVIMVGWAEYNRIRFQGHDSRKQHPALPPLSTADAMGVDMRVALDIQQARRVTVATDSQAVPIQCIKMVNSSKPRSDSAENLRRSNDQSASRPLQYD